MCRCETAAHSSRSLQALLSAMCDCSCSGGNPSWTVHFVCKIAEMTLWDAAGRNDAAGLGIR